ncbi:hypothetical protein FPV67DRAFT_1110612 [Lyophyllum atratum]|nr:hypothetical protein FPV67DRAFT_1110612 [Lyophyllum atratum]
MSTMPSTSNVGHMEGPSLAGFMACCSLYGITCSQTAYYYRNYSHNPMFMKLLVGILFLLETVHLALLGHSAFFVFIFCKVPENTPQALIVPRTYIVSFGLTIIITSLVQALYGWRVWSVSKLHRWRDIMVLSIGVTSFAQFALGVGMDVMLFLRPGLTELHGPTLQGLYSAQLATAMTCDILISISLVYLLHRARTGLRSTENVVNRLILYSVNVGLLTSAMAIVTFATFHAVQQDTTFAFFTETISKIYVNSLLVS